jgi:acyl-CoA thioester hydrolase
MFKHEHQLRVRYAETDRMGYAYYGNYATYLEVARVEALRALGISYRKLEDSGVMLPVLEYNIKYFKPAYYDDLLTVETRIEERPGVRIKFHYTVKNERGDELSKAETTLVFVSTQTGKPTKVPEALETLFDSYF